MYKTVIPLVQGLGYRKPASGEPSSLELVKSTYGVWDEALRGDRGGSVIQNAVLGAGRPEPGFAAVGPCPVRLGADQPPGPWTDRS